MKSINEVLEAFPTNYRNSPHTFALVGDQIEKRFGPKARKEYRAESNCRTFASWLHLGYAPMKGQRALQSITYVEKRDEAGNVIEKYPRKISLFYVSQVAPIEKIS